MSAGLVAGRVYSVHLLVAAGREASLPSDPQSAAKSFRRNPLGGAPSSRREPRQNHAPARTSCHLASLRLAKDLAGTSNVFSVGSMSALPCDHPVSSILNALPQMRTANFMHGLSFETQFGVVAPCTSA